MKELCTVGVFILTSSVWAVCPVGWFRYGDSCYYFENIQKQSWHVAYNTCSTLDGDLVSIETEDENKYLKTELQKLHPGPFDEYWTAGNDIQMETDWIWAGSQLYTDRITGFTDWAPGEPNSVNGEEDCLAFYPRKEYQWNDVVCSKSLNFICEKLDMANVNEVVG